MCAGKKTKTTGLPAIIIMGKVNEKFSLLPYICTLNIYNNE